MWEVYVEKMEFKVGGGGIYTRPEDGIGLEAANGRVDE